MKKLLLFGAAFFLSVTLAACTTDPIDVPKDKTCDTGFTLVADECVADEVQKDKIWQYSRYHLRQYKNCVYCTPAGWRLFGEQIL